MLLLHMDGPNGSTTFTDSSPYNHTVTANGTVSVSTTNSVGGGASGNFNGGGLTITSASSITLGTGDFTVECWLYAKQINSASDQKIWDWRPGNATGWPLLALAYNGDAVPNCVRFSWSGGGTIRSPAISANRWYHLAVVRAAGTVNLYLDGTNVGNLSEAHNIGTAMKISVGQLYSGGDQTHAHIDEFRVTQGLALYTSNFAPPSAALGVNHGPNVQLTSPATATVAANTSVTLTATVTDPDPGDTIDRVEFFDGTSVIATVNNSPYTTSWTVPTGLHSISVIAYDNNGNPGQSQTASLNALLSQDNALSLWFTSSANQLVDDGQYHFTLSKSGASWSSGKHDGGMAFGTHHYLDGGTHPELQIMGDLTLSAWIKSSSRRWQYVVGYINTGNIACPAGYGLVVHSSGNFSFMVGNGSTYNYAASSSTALGGDNTWHHVVGVRRSGVNYI